MNRNCFKGILAVLAVLAALAALAYAIREKMERKKQMLESFLKSDNSEICDEEDSVAGNSSPKEGIYDDIAHWPELTEEDKITMSFLVDKDQASVFQEAAACAGFSSSYDETYRILDLYIQGPLSREALMDIADLLQENTEQTQAVYEGFTFE